MTIAFDPGSINPTARQLLQSTDGTIALFIDLTGKSEEERAKIEAFVSDSGLDVALVAIAKSPHHP